MWWRKISLWGVQEDFRVEVVIDLCLEGWVSRLDWETEEQNNILGGGNGIHKGLEAGKCALWEWVLSSYQKPWGGCVGSG